MDTTGRNQYLLWCRNQAVRSVSLAWDRSHYWDRSHMLRSVPRPSGGKSQPTVEIGRIPARSVASPEIGLSDLDRSHLGNPLRSVASQWCRSQELEIGTRAWDRYQGSGIGTRLKKMGKLCLKAKIKPSLSPNLTEVNILRKKGIFMRLF